MPWIRKHLLLTCLSFCLICWTTAGQRGTEALKDAADGSIALTGSPAWRGEDSSTETQTVNVEHLHCFPIGFGLRRGKACEVWTYMTTSWDTSVEHTEDKSSWRSTWPELGANDRTLSRWWPSWSPSGTCRRTADGPGSFIVAWTYKRLSSSLEAFEADNVRIGWTRYGDKPEGRSRNEIDWRRLSMACPFQNSGSWQTICWCKERTTWINRCSRTCKTMTSSKMCRRSKLICQIQAADADLLGNLAECRFSCLLQKRVRDSE